MKKFAMVLAALAVIGIAMSSAVQAQSAGKTLWQGWVEEVQKAAQGASAPAPAPAPAKAPAKKK